MDLAPAMSTLVRLHDGARQLELAQEAVELTRKWSGSYRGRDVARAVADLATALTRAGRHEEALAASTEAAAIDRELRISAGKWVED